MIPLVQSLLLLIGTLGPGLMKRSHNRPWVNSLIATVIVVACSALVAYTQDQLHRNFLIDATIIIAGISALLAYPLKGFDQFLTDNVPPSQTLPTPPPSAPAATNGFVPSSSSDVDAQLQAAMASLAASVSDRTTSNTITAPALMSTMILSQKPDAGVPPESTPHVS